jgi:hypothetical protein
MSAMKDHAIELDNKWAEIAQCRNVLSACRTEELMLAEEWNFCDYFRPDELEYVTPRLEKARAASFAALEQLQATLGRIYAD